MGLSNFPSPAEGMLPVLVMNTVLSVALFKNMLRSLLSVVGAAPWSDSSNLEHDSGFGFSDSEENNASERRISITQFRSLCHRWATASVAKSGSGSGSVNWAASTECCVCLNGFEAEEEVSELSCKHFFHKGCLDKWFDNRHSTCPVCRSVL